MRVRASVLMIVAAMIAGPARAEFVTGNDLYTKCVSNAPEDKFWCLGFVTGVFDTLPTGPKGLVCPGPNVTAGQVHGVVVKNLQEHPTMRRAASHVEQECRIGDQRLQGNATPRAVPTRNAAGRLRQGPASILAPRGRIFDVDQCADCDRVVVIMSRASKGSVVSFP